MSGITYSVQIDPIFDPKRSTMTRTNPTLSNPTLKVHSLRAKKYERCRADQTYYICAKSLKCFAKRADLIDAFKLMQEQPKIPD